MAVAPPWLRPATVAGLLRTRAAEIPDQEAYLFLANGEVDEVDEVDEVEEKRPERLTWGELDGRARAIALALRESLRPGDRALLLYPPGLDFVAAFFGCLHAGVVAVPAYPPRAHDRSLERLRAVARDAEPRAALTTRGILAAVSAGDLADRAPELAAARWIATDATDQVTGDPADFDLPEPDPRSLAFLQYTSGSTATPKGVMVTHANLMHNEAAIGAAFRQDEESVVVGWLPLYHDMGLIGNVLQPLHAGARCVLMAPAAFLQRPRRWLEAISRYGGTTSGGPNFAYDLCVRRIPPEQREGLDLRSWRVAYNGAEPVRAETLARFAEAFAPCGFDPAAFYPCYGLAEATLFVSGGDADRPPRIAPVTGANPLVSSGHAWGGQRIVIADPETCKELSPGTEGEIWIAGPSVAAGYWRNPEATARDFHAHLESGEGPFLRTGDLGVLVDGELFVTGRIKDLVILRGRNHYPQDLERTAEAAHPELRPGGAAAFAVEEGGSEERLVIVAEVERRRRDDLSAITEAVRRAVAEEHEVQAGEVVLVRPGGVPKTSSGKVRRSACRAAWQAGELPVLERSAMVSGVRGESGEEPDAMLDAAGLAALPVEERLGAIERFVRSRAAAALGIAAAAIDPGRPLTAYGLDSLAALDLKGSVEATLGIALPLSELLAGAGTARLAEGLTPGPSPIALPSPGRGEPPLVLSFGERALWFLDRLAPDAGAYNIAVAARVHGDLDTAALRRAFAALTDRHEALRTVFPLVGDAPARLVRPVGTEAVDFQEISQEISGEAGDLPEEWLAAEAWRPFDLAAGPLLRVRVVRRGAAETVLLLSVHHLVADFWSLAVMARDLAGGLGNKDPKDCKDCKDENQASAFARRQAVMLASSRGEALWELWRQALAGAPDLDLPTDRPRPPVQTWRGLSRAAVLPAGEAAAVRALGAGRGATLFAVLLAAFQAQLGRYAGQDDFAVGAPTAGRGAPEWESTVGYLVNPVALRADLSGCSGFGPGFGPGFGELVERARRTAVAALEGADFPFALLAERLRPARDPARPPLFQVMLALHSRRPGDPPGLPAFALGEALGEKAARLPFAGLELESVRLADRRAQFEISLSAAELPDGGLGLSIEVNADLFDAATAERMLGHFRTLLAAAVEDPARPLDLLPLLTPAEREEIAAEGRKTAAPAVPVPAVTLHAAFLEVAARTPEAPAVEVEGDEERLTYRQLAARSAALAGRLRALGVGPEVAVALCVERSADLIVGLLGILAAGGVYLPLDPEHSVARLGFVLGDAGAAALVTRRSVAARLPETAVRRLFLDDPEGEESLPAGAGAPENLAYLIYTSGSTGRPKGVAVSHGAALAHCLTWASVYDLVPGDRVLQFASTGFDASIEQIFATLLTGATLVLRGREPWGTEDLARRLAGLGVTVADFPTAFWGRWIAGSSPLGGGGLEQGGDQEGGATNGHEPSMLSTVPEVGAPLLTSPLPQPPPAQGGGTGAATEKLTPLADEGEGSDAPPGLRLVGIGGEELRAETARLWRRSPLSRVPLLNSYGPTEAVISATLYAVPPEEAGGGPVPIGRSLPGRVARVLDRSGNAQPVGIPGELCLGGVLARGYLGRPELTAERFVPDPFAAAPGERLYRSGDRVRRRADGEIEFLGRFDDQVKVRGFRIEPGEIEAALVEHPEVRDVAVLALGAAGTDERRLVAFLAADLKGGEEGSSPLGGGGLEQGGGQEGGAKNSHNPSMPSVVREVGAPLLASPLSQPPPAQGGGKSAAPTKLAQRLRDDLRDHLRQRLPDYMIPSAWVILPALPLNPSGKVDRAALARLAPEAAPAEEIAGDGLPRTPTEEILAGIFAELLGVERVGLRDDFFLLGGHSLLATRAVSRIARAFGADLPVSALFQAPTVAALAERLAVTSEPAPPIRPLPRSDAVPLPLSFAQQRLWFLDRLEPGTAVYNLPGAVDLAGPLAVPALTAALSAIVARHEILRTVYRLERGEAVQRIEPPVSRPLPAVDLTALPEALRRAEAERWGRSEARTPFALDRGPVCRFLLLRLAPEEHRLLVTFHHIAADGWSLGLFLDELAASLGGLPLPALPVQYADWAAWQRAWMQGEELERQLAWWRARLAGLPVLELPADHPRPAVRDPRGASRSLPLPAELEAAVARLARQAGVTSFMVLLGAFQTLLARLTGEDAVPVGSPVANRRRAEAEPLLGLFVNTLVLDARMGDDPPFESLLARVREACLGAYAHQDVPFERLVQELQPERDLGQNPLFQVMLGLDEALPARRVEKLSLTPRRADSGTARFDLLLTVTPGADGGWELVTEHAAALFETVTIDRLLGHFAAVLTGAVAEPGSRISALPLLTAAERGQLAAWNDIPPALEKGETTLHGLVAAQALRTPDAEAIVGEEERITYRELMARAGRVAGVLRGLGVGPEVRVGLCLRRTPDMIAAILGVLAAGGAYVPLDPGYPQERLGFMLTDSGAGILWTEKSLADRCGFFEGVTLLTEDAAEGSSPLGGGGLEQGGGQEGGATNGHNPSSPSTEPYVDAPLLTSPLSQPPPAQGGGKGTAPEKLTPMGLAGEGLAYVIYTSGSTGRPKGVGIEHRSAVALVEWALGVYPPEDLRGVLAATSICFDLSIFEIFVPLAAGGRVILAPGVLELPQLAAIGEVTLVNAVPSPMAELVRGHLPAGLRIVNLAGEALKPDLVEKIYAHPQVERVVNLYGPSEDTTYSTWTVVPRGAAVTIGRPIAGTRAWVLGRWGEALPAGVTGELCLGGAGLARGYLGRPELTAEKFVPDPFADGIAQPAGSRLYRTGDRVRLRADGEIEFLGRFDHQVKVRGQRIELGEIEVALAGCPAVAEAAVLLREDGAEGARLVGYLVPAGEAETAAATAEDYLRRRLPHAMVPAAWVVLPELPRSPNGKIDRRALPAPRRAEPAAPTAPRTPAEELLAGLFREVLGLEHLGVHDDFFALGGHSLLAVRLAFRIAEVYGFDVPVSAVFEAPTVARLAERLAAHSPAAEAPWQESGAPEGSYPLSSAQQRFWFMERLHPGGAGQGIGVWVRLAGELSIAALAGSLQAIVGRHEPLRTLYDDVDGQPFQTVPPPTPGPLLAWADLRGLADEPLRDRALRDAAATLIGRPFDLRRGPVARFLLVALGEREHALLSVFHHIAADGWSMEVFFGDLAALYSAAAAGRPAALPALPWRYVDHVLRERRASTRERLATLLAYWRAQLAGAPPLDLPADRSIDRRPARRSSAAVSAPFELPPGLAGELAALARAEGGTLFMSLLTVFLALLARLTGQGDLTVGVPVAGRNRPETAGMIGLFLNTLAVRVNLEDAPGFRALVRRVRTVVVAAQAHQDLPFERLVEELQPERSAGGSPLFRVLFTHLGAAAEPVAIPGLALELLQGDLTAASFDLTCAVHESKGQVYGWLGLAAALFDAATAWRLREHFLALLHAAAAEPERGIGELPLLAPAERQQLLAEWNDRGAGSVEAAAGAGLTVVDLLARRAAEAPERLAVAGGGRSFTYGELSRGSERLARRLARHGVGCEDRVGLLLGRSAAQMLAMLGVWKAGAAWVPLDPAQPEERSAATAADAGIKALLTDTGRVPDWGVPVLDLAVDSREDPGENPEDTRPAGGRPRPGQLAYLIYTSGTTGRPKGVMIEHGSLLRTLLGVQELFPLGADDRVLHLAPLSFDATLMELAGPLLAGGAVEVLTRGEILDLPVLAEKFRRSTRVYSVPSLVRQLLAPLRAARNFVGEAAGEAAGEAPALRHLFLGGERVPADLLRALREALPATVLTVLYGPTEAAIICSAWPVPDGLADERSRIGRPLPGVELQVLDRWGNPAPIGVAGELRIGGGGLARGYHGRPGLTAERFLPAGAGRSYRTGDLVRRLPDGVIEFLGRTDLQVKIRGIRVEPGEVEAALRGLPGVREAVVTAPLLRGEIRLAAYVVAAAGAGAADEPARLLATLREALAGKLPEALVPAFWTLLPTLPLLPSGKIDRAALPPPAALPAAAGEAGDPAQPRTAEEELVLGLFAELLGVDTVGPADDFFALGGHSLLATQLVSRVRSVLGVDLPLALLFESPTPARLARFLEAARPGRLQGGGPPPPPLVRSGRTAAPLSFAQQRLWFLHQLEPDSAAYHVLGALRLRGPLRPDVLARALAAIAGRHEALRTVFAEGPVQVVLPPPAPALPLCDLTSLPPAIREAEATRLLEREGEQPFDLVRGPLLRARLLRLGDRDHGDHLLAVVMHHIISDAWSLGIVLRELTAFYRAGAAGGSPEDARLPELPIQYADFALWQRRSLTGELLERELSHWRRTLAGAPAVLELPHDRPRSAAAGPHRAGRRPFDLSGELLAAVRALGRRDGWTLFMTLLAGFEALLARYSGQEDLVVGSPIANRNRLEIEGLVGFFTNTLALRLDLAGDPTFWEMGRRVRAVALDAYAHQDLPFEKLVEELAPERETGLNPLFQVMLVVQRPPVEALALPGVTAELLDAEPAGSLASSGAMAKFDLTLFLFEGMPGMIEYSRDLFDPATVDRMLASFRTLLAGAVASPGLRLSQLPLLTAAEREELIAWTHPPVPRPAPRLVHEMVAAQAALHPEAEAVVCGDVRLTFGELLARARRLARRLAALGVGPDVPVGICLERSPDLLVSLLAVLEAGGAYLPLDPAYPRERLRLMLEDAGAPVVLTDRASAGKVPGGGAVVVEVGNTDDTDRDTDGEGSLASGVMPENLVYVIYTSGSTGRPKGVAMTHAAISAMLAWQLRTSAAGSGRTLLFTSLSFDVSFQEIFSAWAAGGAVVLVSEDVRRDPPALLALLAAERVERLFLPFVALQQLAVAAEAAVAAGVPLPASLREVMSAGEQLYVTPQVAELFSRLPGAALHNHYGPSETHAVSWLALTGDPALWPERPAIGGPVDHARVFLLDRWLRVVPGTVPGEIWVGGAGVARGYQARPDLTAERFLPDPFDEIAGWRPGDRLYRTGDLARRLPDGRLEFLGRADAQVKIRGQRIEPAEVETALARHPAILQGAVVVRGDSAGARRLMACIVFREEFHAEFHEPPPPTFAEVKAFLAETLPDPMIPSAWVRLDALPLTPSGKLDRRALARIAPEESHKAFEPPRTPAEEILAAIWRDVLGIESEGHRIGRHDDFFELGGHSLLATQVASRLREAFQVELPLRRLFEAPTLEGMAAAAAGAVGLQAETPAPPPIRAAARRGGRGGDKDALGLPLSFAQERLWFLDRLQPGAAYDIPLALRAAGRLDAPALAAAFTEIVRRHEVLRTIYADRDGSPVQIVLPAALQPLPLVDLRDLPATARRGEAARLAAAEAAWVFDLTAGPLLRTVLAALAPEEHLLLVNMHHIVADGWSLGVLVREIKALYGAALRGEPSPLPELAIQYADFAQWQRDWLAGEVLDRQLAWWRERLAGAPAALEVPADRPRPPVQTARGAEHPFTLDAGLAGRLAALGRAEGATPFMVLAAGLFALLSRLTGQRDLVLGTPIANRNRIETEDLIGFFVNNLALRADLSRAASFRDLLRQVREASLGAYAHQDLPFEKLVEELHPDRDLSRSPLFQVAVALQNAPLPAAELAGLTLVPEELPATTVKFDLSFVFVEDGGALAAVLQYATDLFDATTAVRLTGHLEVLLAGIAAQPRARLSELPLLSAGECHQVLAEWNDTQEPVAGGTTHLHQLFEAQAGLRPEALALVFDEGTMTYGELEAAANRLAHLLLGCAIGRGEPVGIWMDRSADLVAAVLAVLKAGGTYVPLDPAWPAERAEVILATTGARAVLTRSGLLPAVQEIQWRLPRLADVICMDVPEATPPPEPLDAESVRRLWDFVAESAADPNDKVTAGGFVSSFTGKPFLEAEVDEYRDRVLALAAPWLRPAARVLEIGCGAGLILWEMAGRTGFCAGLDPSPRTQERNRENARGAGIMNVELAVGFAHEAAEIFGGEFDLIVMASTVQFFPGPLYLERVVREALGLLAPGGALLIADVPDARRQPELRRALTEAGAPVRAGRAPELWLDEDLFRDVSAQAAILHRTEGFANELGFRYDVLISGVVPEVGAPLLTSPLSQPPPAQGGGKGAARRKRLWTGWHIQRQSAVRPAAVGFPEAIAYVIHTSGSTGAPKGIAVQHAPAVELVRWVNRAFAVGPGDRLLFITSPAFDLSVWDLFGVLGAGAALRIAPEEALRDPQLLARLLREEPVTIWDSAPAALQQLMPLLEELLEEKTAESALRLVLLSGDWIPVPLPDRVRAGFPAARVVSLGGATEATVWSNWYDIGAVDPRWPSIPYGRPIANARYHVLDAMCQPCPIGVPGDLLIGGRCLCIGYGGQPDLTAEQFIPDPFSAVPGARLYRTGDRARHGREGVLEFLGRRDQQVKVRGFRIELGEIEVALARHPGVREAVVVVREEDSGEKRLVGYVVPVGAAPANAELRAFLRATLPEYMVPWTFVVLAAMPVTANGKLDRAALPAPQRRAATSAVAPRNALEREIAAAWRDVLGVGAIGVEDNFFEVGGSSLLLGKLQARLRRSLGRDVPFVDLFRHPTIESLARSLAAAPAPAALAEQARARTDTRRERMSQLQKRRKR